MSKKKLVISSGAGISAESGIKTFRDADGLWENYPVMDVASHEGFLRNPALIHKFYNERRQQLSSVVPNEGHKLVASLEDQFNVTVIARAVTEVTAAAVKISEIVKVRSQAGFGIVFAKRSRGFMPGGKIIKKTDHFRRRRRRKAKREQHRQGTHGRKHTNTHGGFEHFGPFREKSAMNF